MVDAQLGFDRVAPFNYFPGWHQPFTAFHLVVGMEAWDALEGTNQAIIETACTAGVIRNLARAEALQAPVLRGYSETGVTTEILSDEILAALTRESKAVLAEEAEKDPDFARVLASQQAFQRDYALWKNIAYPRTR